MIELVALAIVWLLMGCASVLVVAAEFTRHGARWVYLLTRDNTLWLLGMAAAGPISLVVAIVDYRRQSRYIKEAKRSQYPC